MSRLLLTLILTLCLAPALAAQTMMVASPPFTIEYDFGIPEKYIEQLEQELHRGHRIVHHRWEWRLQQPVRVRVFSETWRFCETTNQPWWIGGYYRDATIFMQMPSVLWKRGILQTTVIHEILHAIIHQKIETAFPIWLNEGLALITSEPGQFEQRPANLLPLGQINYQFIQAGDHKADIANAYRSAGFFTQALLNLKGTDGIRQLITILQQRRGFEDAFAVVYKRSLTQFEQRLLNDE